MITNMDWFTETFGIVPEGDVSWNKRIAIAMIRQGLAVVLIEPGSKLPLCVLSARDAAKADKLAQDEAKARHNPGWEKARHPCGIKHAITEEKELNRAGVKRLLEAGANLAISVGASASVAVVDVDTEIQVTEFMSIWRKNGGEDIPLTVSSPGVMSAAVDGEEIWVHKNGGHYWFTLPENPDLPQRPGKFSWCPCHEYKPQVPVCPKAWAFYWGTGYVLVPPSIRREGAYRVTGQAVAAPDWLLGMARAVRSKHEETGSTGALGAFSDDPIDEWSTRPENAWDVLLTADGFTPAGTDSCGCATYTRPGAPTHTKSATAHDPGCTVYDTHTGHGPLHTWSDALGGDRTLSKLSYVAERDFGGDVRAAMTELRISQLGGDPIAALLPGRSLVLAEETHEPIRVANPDDLEDDEDYGDEVDEASAPDTWGRIDLGPLLAGQVKQIEPTIMERADGRCLIYPGLVHSFHGESESGKSLLLMWVVRCLIEDGQDVLWITFDSDATEDVARALRMGASPEAILGHLDYRRPEGGPQRSAGFADMFGRPYALVVIDGVTDALELLGAGTAKKGDPNGAYTLFSRILPRALADMTGAAVVLIDHVTKASDGRGRYAIGAQAKMSQLTGAAYIVEPTSALTADGLGTMTLRVAKDRPAGVRRYSGSWRASDRTQEAARIEVDSRGEFTEVRILEPERDPMTSEVDQALQKRPEAIMLAISRTLERVPEGMNGRGLRGAISGRPDRIALALELLRGEGFIATEPGPRKSEIHRLIRPYTSGEIE